MRPLFHKFKPGDVVILADTETKYALVLDYLGRPKEGGADLIGDQTYNVQHIGQDGKVYEQVVTLVARSKYQILGRVADKERAAYFKSSIETAQCLHRL